MELPEFKDKLLLERALTHRSYVNEHTEVSEHNERLEFLGDALLGYLVGELIYNRYEDLSEAQLTRLRSLLVEEKQLAKFAKQLGIGKIMRLGKGAEKDKGRENPALLCDAFEAVIGAYYLDAKMTKVKEYITKLFTPVADQMIYQPAPENPELLDEKNRFQQWALGKIGVNPEYIIISESGPDHNKIFTAQVSVKGKKYGTGKGKRKQDAEKSAAEDALKELGII